ncbi:MAG: aldehyde dehydrogenase family protein [Lentisphaeraceae bacterium]|nr:aldehyde dehydrogenase family protein [Lentisphaeraceae bacterium]
MPHFHTHNPYTLEQISIYKKDDIAALKTKVSHANTAYEKWHRVNITKRIELLRKALNYFAINRDEVAGDITAEMGKPLNQSYNELKSFFERAEYLLTTAEDALEVQFLPELNDMYRRIEHVPLGTILIISAWNYPLLISINGVLSALLAGNSVLLKHAESTLAIGQHFAKAFGQISGYENLLEHVIADHNLIDDVIENENIHHVIFTGSAKAGHQVYAHTAKRFIECHLELGGKDGAYVAADTDPVSAAEALVDGAMYNAGQSCCGIERVYVHEENYESFIKKCRELIEDYRLGDPMEENCDMGPLGLSKSADLMERQLADALSKRARILCGGQRKIINKGIFFEPTLVVDVNHGMLLMQEENFGPILAVMKVQSDDEAIDLINDSQYGLTAAIFTNDIELTEKFASKVNTGTVFSNRCDYLDPALPWTGVKNSGKGSALSQYGFLGVTRCKTMNFRQ